MRKWLVPALAALGLADSAYLAEIHWLGELPPCGGYSGCGTVSSSPYAELFGVPVGAFGAVLYAVALAIALRRALVADRGGDHETLFLYGLALAGAVFMAYLTAVEAFVLHAYCYWCLGLAAVTYLLLALVGAEVLELAGRGPLRPAPIAVRDRAASRRAG